MNRQESKSFADDVAAACDVMRRGGVILYPTDTVWGIGCDACNAEAVRRVFAVKRRAESKSLISLVSSAAMLSDYVKSLPAKALALADSQTDRPVTMVLDSARGIAPDAIAADGSAAFRLTREAFSAALCNTLGGPVISTSANISGQPGAAVFADISRDILEAVDYVATTRRGDLHRSLPSKIVKISADGAETIIRP